AARLRQPLRRGLAAVELRRDRRDARGGQGAAAAPAPRRFPGDHHDPPAGARVHHGRRRAAPVPAGVTMLPAWTVAAGAALIILFGGCRIKLAFRSREEEQAARQRGGLFGYGRRTHVLFGIVYILMGVLLLLGLFGVKMPWQIP